MKKTSNKKGVCFDEKKKKVSNACTGILKGTINEYFPHEQNTGIILGVLFNFFFFQGFESSVREELHETMKSAVQRYRHSSGHIQG